MTAVVARLVETGRLAPADLDALGRRLHDADAKAPPASRPKLVRAAT